MSKYFGEIGQRYTLEITLHKEFVFEKKFGYLTQYISIYIMSDADGHVFVWKTQGSMGKDGCDWVKRGDKAVINATVKEHSLYNDTEQTVLQRVKVVSIDHQYLAEREEAERERKAAEHEKAKQEQLDSIKDGDEVIEMLYSRYKEHYADCETIMDSFVKEEWQPARIKVIVRAGRLKASGVRGKHFRTYYFDVDGGEVGYYAVSWENAEKRCRKDFPDAKEIKHSYMLR